MTESGVLKLTTIILICLLLYSVLMVLPQIFDSLLDSYIIKIVVFGHDAVFIFISDNVPYSEVLSVSNTAVTNNYTLDDSKQCKFITSLSVGPYSRINFTGLNHGVTRAMFPLESPGENSFPCLFQFVEIVSIPSLLALFPSSKPL